MQRRIYKLTLPNDRTIVAGKVCEVKKGTTAFYVKADRERDYCEKYGGWSIEPQIVEDLIKNRIEAIVYDDGEHWYFSTPQRVLANGIRESLRWDMGVRLHVPDTNWLVMDKGRAPAYLPDSVGVTTFRCIVQRPAGVKTKVAEQETMQLGFDLT